MINNNFVNIIGGVNKKSVTNVAFCELNIIITKRQCVQKWEL